MPEVMLEKATLTQLSTDGLVHGHEDLMTLWEVADLYANADDYMLFEWHATSVSGLLGNHHTAREVIGPRVICFASGSPGHMA